MEHKESLTPHHLGPLQCLRRASATCTSFPSLLYHEPDHPIVSPKSRAWRMSGTKPHNIVDGKALSVLSGLSVVGCRREGLFREDLFKARSLSVAVRGKEVLEGRNRSNFHPNPLHYPRLSGSPSSSLVASHIEVCPYWMMFLGLGNVWKVPGSVRAHSEGFH